MTKKLAWSYSALTAFETCPHRYWITRVAKTVKEPQTEATMWGNQVHKALEQRMCGFPLPKSMESYEKFAVSILNKGGRVETEQKIAVNAAFQPTGYFATDVWCRAVTDVTVEKEKSMFVGDWKTGKRTENSEQLRLSAAMSFAFKPYIEKVTVAFIWLNDGGLTVDKFVRDDAVGIWQGFLPRVNRLQHAMDTNTWPKNPSGLCKKHCPVTSCEFNGKFTGVQS